MILIEFLRNWGLIGTVLCWAVFMLYFVNGKPKSVDTNEVR